MPDDRTVLDHLLDGRDALLQEVTRLTAAIEQLDSVLGRIGASDRSNGTGTAALGSTTSTESSDVDAPAPEPVEQVAAEPVNPPAEVEPAVPARPQTAAPRVAKATRAASRTAKRAPAKAAAKSARPAAKAPAKTAAKKAPPRVVRRAGEPPKSIRVHVLEMLAAENRDFGLAEIIDRVHDAGIQAHDDAVRSITIKLMKDGRVERVGRGQYRLARRGAAARAASAATATAPRVTETAPEPTGRIDPPSAPSASVEPPAPFEPAPFEAPAATTETVQSEVPPPAEPAATDGAFGSTPPDAALAETTGNDSFDDDESDEDSAPATEFTPASVPRSYTPPLNLGQPWSGGK